MYMHVFAYAFVYLHLHQHLCNCISWCIIAHAKYQPDSIDRHKHFDEQINSKTLCKFVSLNLCQKFWNYPGWLLTVRCFRKLLREGQHNQIIYVTEQRKLGLKKCHVISYSGWLWELPANKSLQPKSPCFAPDLKKSLANVPILCKKNLAPEIPSIHSFFCPNVRNWTSFEQLWPVHNYLMFTKNNFVPNSTLSYNYTFPALQTCSISTVS